MRERPNFRLELEQLNIMFPNKADLSAKDIMKYLGVSRSTLKRHYPQFSKGCTKVQLAQARG